MPLSKAKDRQRKQFQPNSNLSDSDVTSINSNLECNGLSKECGQCIKALECELGGYQYWYKLRFGRYDIANVDRCPLPR